MRPHCVSPQVGAFYEAVGIDAVLLMEYAGLNPMGGTDRQTPRAGCPDVNLQQLLKQVVEEAGFEVVRAWTAAQQHTGQHLLCHSTDCC